MAGNIRLVALALLAAQMLVAQSKPYAGWNIDTIAGSAIVTGIGGTSQAGVLATEARLNSPGEPYLDGAGRLFFSAAGGYHRLRSDGFLELVPDFSGRILGVRTNGNFFVQGLDSIDEYDANLRFLSRFRELRLGANCRNGMRESASGIIYCMDDRRFVIRLGPPNASSSSLGTSLLRSESLAFATDAAGNVYHMFSGRLVRVTREGVRSNLTDTTGGHTDGPASSRQLSEVSSMTFDAQGNLLLYESPIGSGACRLRVFTTARQLITINTSDGCGFSGDGGLASNALIQSLGDLLVTPSGDVIFADSVNDRIRRIYNSQLSGVRVEAVASAASYQRGAVAPGEIVTVFGEGWGTDGLRLAAPSGGQFPTSLGNTRLLIDGTAVPLLYDSRGQMSGIIPFWVADLGRVTMRLETANGRSADLPLTVALSRPALFTADGSGLGQAAALNQSGALNGQNAPARPGEVVILYSSGLGSLLPEIRDGVVAGATLSRTATPVQVVVQGVAVSAQYAGTAPGLVAGCYQVNFALPRQGLTAGNVQVQLRVGTVTSVAGVTIRVAVP